MELERIRFRNPKERKRLNFDLNRNYLVSKGLGINLGGCLLARNPRPSTLDARP